MKKKAASTWNSLVCMSVVTRRRNRLRNTDDRLRMMSRRRRRIVGDALKRAVGNLIRLLASEASVLPFIAHTRWKI